MILGDDMMVRKRVNASDLLILSTLAYHFQQQYLIFFSHEGVRVREIRESIRSMRECDLGQD